MDRRDEYKALPSRFDREAGRLRRTKNLAGRRRQQREENVAKHRRVEVSPDSDCPPETTLDRMEKLAKWKEERELKRKKEQAKKRPPFKVGVPHHKLYSPPSKVANEPHRCYRRKQTTTESTSRGLISKATQKRLEIKSQPRETEKLKKSPKKVQESPLKSEQDEAEPVEEPSPPVPPLVFGVIPTNMRPSLNDTANESASRSYSPVPASFSPFIVASRGKSNARKEQMIRLGLNNSLRDEVPTKDTVMQQLNISAEEEERTAQYYKYRLNNEITRLTELCETWKKIQEDPATTEDGQYIINQAIGQTNLLLNKKFKRFQSLVNDCETGRGEMLVRCRDLQGFWDTLSLEIKNCDTRFEKVSEARANNWVEENPEIDADAAPPPKKRKPVVAAKKKPTAAAGKSNFRLFMEAARKQAAMKDKENVESPEKREKKDATPRRTSSRLKKSPGIIITVPTPKVEFDSSKIYPNSTQTPGKGILKKAEDLSQSIGLKSALKVNFNDDLSICEDMRSPVKLEIPTGVEKKLTYDDSPPKTTPKIIITRPSIGSKPAQEEISPVKIESPVARVLRNRAILRHSTPKSLAGPSTPRKIRRSIKSDLDSASLTQETPKEQTPAPITPRKKRRSSKSVSIIPETAEDTKHLSPVNSPNREKSTNRRSKRMSVKLDVSDDCTVCLQTLPAPATPRSKKRNASLLSGEFIEENLISFSPATPRSKVRKIAAALK